MSTEHHVSWTSVTSKIKHKWKKIEDSDIESMNENLDMLSDKLQSIYSYPKTKADKEVKEFRTSLEQKPKHH
ncbi:MAG: hypothetical protein H7281_06190 [Bacteriovorax sp.]|nr:hypothetical protein [Bacteriovorax sp.]